MCHAFFPSLLALVACASPRPSGKIPLWPEGRIPDFRPAQAAAWHVDAKTSSFVRADHAMPYLSWYAPPDGRCRTDACMLLLSGGGYACVSDAYWIDVAARLFRERGIHCAALVYRTPSPKGLPIYRSAWQDGQRAVRLLRKEAAARGYSPAKIGVFGYSAGAHLAMLLAASSQTRAYTPVDALDAASCHVDLAVPMYVPFALTDGLASRNVRGGDTPDVALDAVFAFDARTCPTCLQHGGVDDYSPMASVRLYERLRKAAVPAELHLFADVGHGFMGEENRGDAATGPDNWFDRIADFMRRTGFIPASAGADERRVGAGRRTAETVREALWPAGAVPEASGPCPEPALTWYLPEKPRTRAVQIVLAADGDRGEASVAESFNAKGMAAVVVSCRVSRPGEPAGYVPAWQDARRAVRLVRRGAPARGLDPDRIGVMGFSVGGHLALMCATSARSRAYRRVDAADDVSCAVRWAVPVSPVSVLGADGRFAPGFAFDLDTPPMCFLHADGDVHTPLASVKTWTRLRRMGVQSDLHTLAVAEGKLSPAFPGTWFGRVWEFLNHKGFNRRDSE